MKEVIYKGERVLSAQWNFVLSAEWIKKYYLELDRSGDVEVTSMVYHAIVGLMENQKDEGPQGHPHAELMLELAEVAKTNPKPWKEFQLLHANGIDWLPLKEGQGFHSFSTYRRKPSTKLIHGVEVPDISFVPDVGSEFHIPNIGLPNYLEVGSRSSERCSFTLRMVERGLCYPHTEEGKQAAILHAKAMLGIK